MSTRAALWAGFTVVHIVLIGVEFLDGKLGSRDVDQVYRWWSYQAAGGTAVPGVTEAWVYPAVALLPMLLAWALGAVMDYTLGWGLVVTAADALAFALLVGSGRSRGRTTAAWFWLLAALALGGVGMFRLDGLTVPLSIAGLLWLVGRPWLGAALLAVATWVKVWPAALLAAAFIAVRRRWVVAASAAAVSAVVGLVVAALGGAAHLLSFIGDQTTRGLQIEAPVSTFYLWVARLGLSGAWIYYDTDLQTFQVTGPDVDVVIAAMTPLMAIAMLAVAAVGAAKAWRGAAFAALFPSLALALVLAFIVFNKVGSPQYLTWLIPPLVLGLAIDRGHWWRPALLALAVLALTQVIFPWTYDALLALRVGAVLILTIRNILLIVLFAWAAARIVRVRLPAARPLVPLPAP